jgi:hypothetical protein
MNTPALSDVRDRVKKLPELIQRLEIAEDGLKTVFNDKSDRRSRIVLKLR